MRRRYLRNRSDRISYPGLIAAWSAKGKTNDDVDRNVLKDLTGNGHDITLNNFAYSGMSGYGGYLYNLSLFYPNGRCDYVRKDNILYLSNIRHPYSLILADGRLFSVEGNKIKVNIKGIPKNGEVIFGVSAKNPEGGVGYIRASKDGYYEGNFIKDGNENTSIGVNQNCIGSSITIEFIPEYPDALVFDGVDDYGINKNMPTELDNFTCIIKRTIITPKAMLNIAIEWKSNSSLDFIAELPWDVDSVIRSKGAQTIGVPLYKEGVIVITPNKYNTIHNIAEGSSTSINTLQLGNKCNYAFYSAYLFDRSLDDQEIKSFIRKHIDPEYLLPSEIPTPDVYYDFTNGDNSKGEANNVIKDLSGNGNDATAHNFAWNEESGYAGGGLKFDGVDDYISLDAFDSGFKTVFMLITTDSTGGIFYDQRDKNYTNSRDARFVLLTQFEEIAYNWGNINGITYINGKLNTKIINTSLKMKKHLVCVVNSTADAIYTTTPSINQSVYSNFISHAKNKLYKFLGFKEALTEEQIKAVIKKYNLLDGVDNIDVN